MNRSEAQQQLAAVAQALREKRILDPRDYPILDVPTHQGIPLWRIKDLHLFNSGWSRKNAINWLESKAITYLVLDDEENLGLQELHRGD